jgi:hypothetical protein
MRKITQKAYSAFMLNKNFKSGNTEVINNSILLHGNKILWRDENRIFWSLCGWNTVVTRERLSPFVQITCRNRIPYVNNIECWKGII